MNTRIAALAVVALACVAAAGIGGYLAVRESAQGPAAASAPRPVAPAAIPETTAKVEPSTSVTDPAGIPASEPRQAQAAPASSTSPRVRPSRSSKPAAVAVAPPPAPVAGSTQPSSAEVPATPAAPTSPVETAPPPAPVIEPPSVAPAEPEAQLEELVVPADAVVGLQVDRTISSDFARIEDRVDARVTRDVRVGGEVAVPAGARVQGTVVMVERGGKFKERARLGVRFHTIVLADGSRLSMQSETVFREGDSPSAESAKKVGGAAVGGAIIGAILGGGRGAAIGAATGAAGGTAAVAAGERNPALLAAGATVTVRLASPMTVIRERE